MVLVLRSNLIIHISISISNLSERGKEKRKENKQRNFSATKSFKFKWATAATF